MLKVVGAPLLDEVEVEARAVRLFAEAVVPVGVIPRR